MLTIQIDTSAFDDDPDAILTTLVPPLVRARATQLVEETDHHFHELLFGPNGEVVGSITLTDGE